MILAYMPMSCKKFDDECEIGEKDLYLSKDTGKTWKKIADKISSVK